MGKVLPLVLALLLAIAGPAWGQLSLELRGGGAIGNHEEAAAGLETVPGPVLGIGLEYGLLPMISAYAGYTRASFGCEEGFCAGADVTFTSSGGSAGIRLDPPLLPWVRAGLIYHTLSTDATGFDDTSDPVTGYEAAVGFTMPLAPRVQALPAVVYRRHPIGDGSDDTTLVSAELGVRIRLR